MIQVKVFHPSEQAAINEFLAEHVASTISFRESLVSVTYDDGTPLRDFEKRALLIKQANGLEYKVMEADVNYRLSLAEVTKAGKKSKQALLDQHEANRKDLENTKETLNMLRSMIAELSNTTK